MKVAFLINEFSNLFDNIRDAVIAVKGDEICYSNEAASRLVPDLAALKPSDFLPAQALIGMQENFKGELILEGRRADISVSTVGGCRLCVLIPTQRDDHAETAELLTAAGVELKNMLSVLKMAAGLLAPYIEAMANPRVAKYSAMIYHCFYNMLRLTNNISDLGAFLRGDATLTRSSFDIVTSCRELIGTVTHLTEDSGAVIRFVSNEDSIHIYADRLRLDRLLLNLLANSLRSLTRGGIVVVSVKSAGDRVVLSVSDCGDGISAEVLPTAWSRYGAPRDLAEFTGGIGLGLAIVQHIARLHGGSAVLESKAGEGTTVTVSLPVVYPEAPDFRTRLADYDGYGMEQILTELSGVMNYEKYTQVYMD